MISVKNAALESLIRHIATSGGTLLFGKGVVDSELGQMIIGVIVTLVGLLWAFYDKQSTGVIIKELAKEADEVRVQREVVQEVSQTPKPATFAKGYSLSERSRVNLEGVHPVLVEIIEEAIVSAPFDFTVVEGVRSLERQKALYNGRPRRTWTMNSKHLIQEDGFAHAVDLYIFNGKAIDEDLAHYAALNAHIQEVANTKGVFDIEWGGEWKVRDGFHWQINV